MIVGQDGPAVILDARTCAWLEKYAGLSSARVKVRGTDPHISAQLEQVRFVAMAWSGPVGRTERTEPANPSEPVRLSERLDTRQVADLLGVSPRAVQKCITRGELQAHKEGRTWVVGRDDYRHFRAARDGRSAA